MSLLIFTFYETFRCNATRWLAEEVMQFYGNTKRTKVSCLPPIDKIIFFHNFAQLGFAVAKN